MPAKTPSATSLHNESKMCFTRTRKFHDEIRRFALTIWRSLNLYLVEIGQRRRSIRSACFHFPIVSCARNFEVVNRQTCSELTKDSVCVVGAGIIGLTTAYRIAEKNIPVHILARDTIYSATADPSVVKPYASSGAGGFWWPFHIEPEHKVAKWAAATYKTFLSHIQEDCGVSVHDAFVLQATKFSPAPWYKSLTKLEAVSPDEDSRVPKSYKGAYRFKTVMVYMEKYIAWLHEKLQSMGHVTIHDSIPKDNDEEEWNFSNIKRFIHDTLRTDVVVNCAGLGAGTFTNDTGIFPGRGVILVGRKDSDNQDFTHCVTETQEDGLVTQGKSLAYTFPRGSELITMGGLYDEGNYSLDIAEEEIDGIRERVGTIVSSLKTVKEVYRWVGLRPCRHGGVRIEIEHRSDERLRFVHNYGHGGGGVTTCWGCADDAARLVLHLLGRETI